MLERNFAHDAFTTFKDPGLLRNLWGTIWRDTQDYDRLMMTAAENDPRIAGKTFGKEWYGRDPVRGRGGKGKFAGPLACCI